MEGHTDSVGGDEYNLKLSENRANSVRGYPGLAVHRSAAVTAKGFGKTMPVADNSTAAGRQANRRVELVVSGEILGTTIETRTSSSLGDHARRSSVKKIVADGVRVAAFTLFPAIVLAQGGPPFRSDDPDTPGNGHWEINLGFLGRASPFGGSYSTPDIDINYGLGNRLQLKYEVPVGVEEMRGDSSHVAAGLGNSLLGAKYHFYQRHSKTRVKDGEREVKFSLSTYPQLLLSNPTRAVARDIAEPAPQLLLP